MLKKETIDTIKNMSIKDSWQSELFLKSETFQLSLICLHIKDIILTDELLSIKLDNRREFDFLLTDDLECEVKDRFDLKVIEENISRLELLRRKRAKKR